MEHIEYLERMEIPRDDEDYRYTICFRPSDAGSDDARAFFNTYGFVVFRDVVPNEISQAAREDMWSLLEEVSDGFSRADQTTWNQAKLSHYGMPSRDPIFRSQILSLRQHRNVHRCFASVLEDENIICSHDRWLLQRKTKGVFGGQGQDQEMP